MGTIPPRRKKNYRIYLSLLRTWLLKIWHLSDDFYWMDPLPHSHRRGIIMAGIILLLALLWPYSADHHSQPSLAPDQSSSAPLKTTLLSHDLSVTSSKNPSSENWHSYQIQAGKTLAQLFRDNNLPVNDAFAMAQVEGNNKPLSNLTVGQEVKIMLDKQGLVKILAINTANNEVVFFTRQDDGSYRRHGDTDKR